LVDRRIVYTGEIPLDVDILQPQRNMEIAIGMLSQAVIGQELANPPVAIDGFVLATAVPPSLILNVGQGSIYAQGVVDQTAFGSLPADVTDVITLQGISIGTTPLTFTPPGTAGFSTNYLVQVGLSTQDGTPIVLPYYNAANPPVPWLGPNNTGVSQNTVRQCLAVIQAKAGIPASSGTQINPAPDPGFFGVYSVVVANGTTALTSGNFSLLATAPIIPAPLMAIPQAVQSGKWTFSEDTGSANALIAALVPAPFAIIDGMEICVEKGNFQNTGPSTLVVNGSAPIAIHTISGAPLSGGEMPALAMLSFKFDGVFWQLQNVTAASFGGPLFDGDATGTNTYSIANLTPSATALFNRMLLKASFAVPNTAASTLNVGFGANPIIYTNGQVLTGGEIVDQHLLSYKSAAASWEILTPSKVAGTTTPLFAPRIYYVNATTGLDTNTGLSAGTAFQTIQRAIVVTQSLNMNGFNVTVNVAAGTYTPFSCTSLNGAGTLSIIGDTTTPANVLVPAASGEAIIGAASGYVLAGMKVSSAANGSAPHLGDGLRWTSGSVQIYNMEFGPCANSLIHADAAGVIDLFGSQFGGLASNFINISGAAPNAIQAGGGILYNGGIILNVFAGTFNFSTAFATAFSGGAINQQFGTINLIGTVTGPRYFAFLTGTINTLGGGANYFPGNSAGTVSSGGQYA
jgi:hypothetical protein